MLSTGRAPDRKETHPHDPLEERANDAEAPQVELLPPFDVARGPGYRSLALALALRAPASARLGRAVVVVAASLRLRVREVALGLGRDERRLGAEDLHDLDDDAQEVALRGAL